MEPGPHLEKALNVLSTGIDDFTKEQYTLQNYYRQLYKHRQDTIRLKERRVCLLRVIHCSMIVSDSNGRTSSARLKARSCWQMRTLPSCSRRPLCPADWRCALVMMQARLMRTALLLFRPSL